MIKQCKCKNTYQDKKYGSGYRVHNPLKKVEKLPQRYRCVVCGETRK